MCNAGSNSLPISERAALPIRFVVYKKNALKHVAWVCIQWWKGEREKGVKGYHEIQVGIIWQLRKWKILAATWEVNTHVYSNFSK